MGPKDQRAIWQQVADRVGGYPSGATRSDIARDFKIHKSTALSHLEKCVNRGWLVKMYTWTGTNSRGWVYYNVSTAPAGLYDDQDTAVALQNAR